MKNAALFFLLVLSAQPLAAQTKATDLFTTLSERLHFMQTVALYKQQHQLPIEDLEREKVVVKRAKMSALQHGLSAEHIEAFFVAQISAAKAIQYRYRADWLSQPPAHKSVDLQREVRPDLLRLGDKAIKQMVDYLTVHQTFNTLRFEQFDTAMTIEHLTRSDKMRLFNALKEIELAQ